MGAGHGDSGEGKVGETMEKSRKPLTSNRYILYWYLTVSG